MYPHVYLHVHVCTCRYTCCHVWAEDLQKVHSCQCQFANVPIPHSIAKLTHSQVKEWDQGFPSIPEMVTVESLIKILC